MDIIRKFNQLDKNDAARAGGKGASLGEMTQAGLPVPPGFVILASAFDRFLDETNLTAEVDSQVHELNYQDIARVERASEDIRGLINAAEMPADLQKQILTAHRELGAPLVAVRSSATAEDSLAASWAGELESYLDVTKKDVLEKIQQCWSSLFTPRALVYRHEKGLHLSKVAVAVVVQKMVQSETAGVCFTVHPVTKDKHQIIIEACWGLGEALVGGLVTPDSYVVDKRDWSLIDVQVNEQKIMIARRVGAAAGTFEKAVPKKLQHQQKLSGQEVIALAKICADIEMHYKFPCDIEWAREKEKFYVVQSRPITTLS